MGRSMKLYIKDNGVGFDLKEMKAKKDKGIGINIAKRADYIVRGKFNDRICLR